MKRVVTILGGFLLFIMVGWGQQDVGTSPLEYNPEKYYQHHKSFIDNQSMQKNLYPLCSNNYYIHDTISLPFVDDFSQNHFSTYHSWDWPTSIDSIARVYRLTPDTVMGWDTAVFKYSLTPTRHYVMLSADTVDAIDSSHFNPPRQLILYGNCENPFIATDTLTVYAITSPRYYWDTLSLHVLSAVIFPDGTLNGDTIDTINVFFPIANNNLWVDNFAYRNISMGIDPPTYGVVTFDGTNEFGKAYSPGANNSYGIADYLTSKPINLSTGSNIYISFFTQPKGLGYRPAEADSFVLEFYSPVTNEWYHAWSEIGDTLTGNLYRPFTQTILPITNPLFLQNGFQFRFKNYGNLSGNLDHWNLDYVRLNSGRNPADTIIDDVAFVYLPPSILNFYTSMPYEQYQLSNRNTKWNNYISNLNNTNETISYTYDLRNEQGGLMNQYPTNYTPPGTEPNTITPFHPNGYTSYQRWSEPDFNDSLITALPPGLTCCPFNDSARFTIHHYLTVASGDVNHENDSIVLHQDFLNYYSYDDGTAEQAMWLGTPGHMAVKFTNNFPDTLRALQFYFSPIKDDVSSRFITLEVYSGDLNTLIYSTSRQVGVLDADPNGIVNKINNGYTTYIFPDTVIIPLPAGDFYVGWYQSQIFKLNVGFDLNLDNSGITYYRTTGVWDTLSLAGTLMIRPIVGRNLYKSQIGIEEYWNNESINLYPNPTNNTIYYTVFGDINLTGIRIIDIAGKLVYQSNNLNANEVDVSGFAQGLYFMQFISDKTDQPLTKKFIISR